MGPSTNLAPSDDIPDPRGGYPCLAQSQGQSTSDKTRGTKMPLLKLENPRRIMWMDVELIKFLYSKEKVDTTLQNIEKLFPYQESHLHGLTLLQVTALIRTGHA